MVVACLLALATTPADLVVRNAQIWSDGLPAFAECLAVKDGRFVHIGEFSAVWVGPETIVVDAEQRVILPGLIDSHIHMLSGGLGLRQVDLRPASDRNDFIRRVREYAAGLAADAWVQGGRWSVESWDEPESPRREWIDEVTGGRPAYLIRMDGHSALANSEALRRAGIDRNGPPDPEGGVIDRDPNGEPTGILRESAMYLVSRLIPPASETDQLDALRAAMRHANAHGITAVGDIPGLGSLELYERLTSEETTVRFFLYPVVAEVGVAANRLRNFAAVPAWRELRGFKAYLDGTLGSRTALMREPFLGNPEGQEDWRGLFREGVTDGRFERNVRAAQTLGLQTIAHAIGDEANHFLLSTVADAYGSSLRDARCRSEHAQHLLPDDIERFARLGVIASMQPYHKADDGRYAEDYLGEERCRSSYAFKSLLDRGAVLVFGSDWPVVSIDPFLGVEAAVTGRTLDGRIWMPQENLTIAEALRCYTSRAAFGLKAEDEIGRIAIGLRADFVVLDRSPFAERVEWAAVKPWRTYVEGRVVYEQTSASAPTGLTVSAHTCPCEG